MSGPPPNTGPDDWTWVQCPCVAKGPRYTSSMNTDDLSGDPDWCDLCENRGEVPDWALPGEVTP